MSFCCHFVKCHSTECYSVKFHSSECYSVKCNSTECHLKCHSAECRFSMSCFVYCLSAGFDSAHCYILSASIRSAIQLCVVVTIVEAPKRGLRSPFQQNISIKFYIGSFKGVRRRSKAQLEFNFWSFPQIQLCREKEEKLRGKAGAN